MKTKYGYMKCETRKCINGEGGTGKVVVFKRAETDTLSYRCDECGQSPHALKGTGAHAQWESEIEKSPAPVTDQASRPPAASLPGDKKEKKNAAPPPAKPVGSLLG